uniref:Glycine-rich protein n=1 Tax=Leersia perrieri TaxID=77586 RepID=A0A0D9VHP3_9ORYZ
MASNKALLVFALLLAGAFLVNCAQPQPNTDPAADPGNEDPNGGAGGSSSSGYGNGGGGGGAGAGGYGYGGPRRCRWGCCECGYYRCNRCC